MYGLYLIAVLAVTGGAIAFIGDRLGTKIGKKRLSLFGLRPRHTSNVITVITGILITALTIGITSIASENVRTALFGMEELNANLESTRHELDTVSGELTTAKGEYKKASDDLEKSKVEVEQLQNERLELKNEQEQLKEESHRLKEGNQKLELSNAKLISDNEELTSSNHKLSEDNKNLTSNNEELKSSNKELEQRAEHLRDGLVAMREGDIVFRAGEILSSGVIKGNRDADEVVKDIDAMAERATAMVSQRIGNTGDNSVWIYQPELSEAVEAISKSKQDMVLRITAAGNLMRGEPVRTSLQLYKNNKVYDADEFIIARAYEVKESGHGEIIVRNFLTEVNRAAVAKGVLPDPIRGTVGAMDVSQLYELVEAVSAARGPIVLTAYAENATEAIGPLRLNIKLEQAKGGSKI